MRNRRFFGGLSGELNWSDDVEAEEDKYYTTHYLEPVEEPVEEIDWQYAHYLDKEKKYLQDKIDEYEREIALHQVVE